MPDYNLGVKGAERIAVIGMTEEAMMPILKKVKPDIVLVYGDVNGAVGAAMAAKKSGCRLGHVEAGLRSFDESMPEELNRIEIDKLADLLFVSEQFGLEQIQNEKLKGKAMLVGNTMIDTLIRMMPLIQKAELPQGLPEKFVIATLHRPSNVDNPEVLRENLKFLDEVSARCPVVLPLHHRTKASMEKFTLASAVGDNIYLIDPLGYTSFLALVQKSQFVLTDSGGIQEEATYLKKKCFTLRLNTERPSTIESGSNSLVNLGSRADRGAVLAFAAMPEAPLITVPQLWDGRAGERIVAQL